MQAVIMAGGKGTRLKTITNDEIPKPLAPINGKPILQWQIEQLRENGIIDIVLVVGYLGEKIISFFGDGAAFGVSISYIEEREPLGTAGALYYLKDKLTSDAFFLIFGDVIFDIDLEKMAVYHKNKNALATLFVHPNTHPFDSDLVVCNEADKIIRFDSKHNDRSTYWYDNCVNAGFYIFNQRICDYIEKPVKTDLEKELLSALVAEGREVYAYHSPEYIKDVGTVQRIKDAEQELISGFVARRNLKRPQKAIFLDRDGTINRRNGLICNADQFELEDCASEAIEKINRSGYLAIVITNQPVVARGLCEIEDVYKIHRKMSTLLGRNGVLLDDVKFCPHHPDKGYPGENPLYKVPCHCRKPDIGMIEDCAERYNIDLAHSWFVGDTTVDIKTGENAGLHTALVLTGDAGSDKKYEVTPTLVAENLLLAVEKILEENRHGLCN